MLKNQLYIEDKINKFLVSEIGDEIEKKNIVVNIPNIEKNVDIRVYVYDTYYFSSNKRKNLPTKLYMD